MVPNTYTIRNLESELPVMQTDQLEAQARNVLVWTSNLLSQRQKNDGGFLIALLSLTQRALVYFPFGRYEVSSIDHLLHLAMRKPSSYRFPVPSLSDPYFIPEIILKSCSFFDFQSNPV
jgi:hypothetical protein